MPQVFQVLKCYKCSVFQVHQTKKSNKFDCKMCGEKQSIKRHYGVGNGQECRGHVQKLNALRGESNELNSIEGCLTSEDEEVLVTPSIELIQKKPSKWLEYIENDNVTEITDEDNDVLLFENEEVVLEAPAKKHHKRSKTNEMCNIESQKQHKMKTNLGSATKYNIKPKKEKEAAAQHTGQIKFKYDDLQKDNNKFSGQNKIQLDRDNSENVDFSNCISHNKSADLSENKPCKLKFIPPVVNANSKWAKFAESEYEHIEILEASLNVSQFDDKKSQIDIIQKQVSCDVFVECEKNVDTDDNLNSDYAMSSIKNVTNVKQKNSNWKNFSTDPNNLIGAENDCTNTNVNELYYNSLRDVNKGNNDKDNPRGLFSLCDDDEIDDYLNI